MILILYHTWSVQTFFLKELKLKHPWVEKVGKMGSLFLENLGIRKEILTTGEKFTLYVEERNCRKCYPILLK